MTRPAVHSTTERIYDRLPGVYRAGDDAQADGLSGYPLLRYLSLLGDQLGEVVDLLQRFDYYSPDDGGHPGDTSDLTDPNTADPAWLPWLAQLVGADLGVGLPVDQQRAAIAGGLAGFLKGTKQGIAAAAQSALTGTKYAQVIPLYAGDQFRVEVRTRTSETASTAAVLDAIISRKAKPAGIELVPTTYEATWAQIEAAYTTWANLETLGPTWLIIEETGAPVTGAPPSPPVYLGPRLNDYLLNKTSGAGGDYVDGDVWLYTGTYYLDPIDLTPGNGYHRAYDATKPYGNHLRIREYDGPGTVTIDLRPESAASYRAGTGAGGHQTQTEAYNDSSHGGGMRNVAGTAGSLRWIFDGAFKFQNGAIYFTAARQFSDGSTVSGSNVFNSASLAADASLVGHVITGYSIPPGTTITAVNSGTQVVMSNNATATTSGATMFGHVASVAELIFHGTSHTFPITEWRRQFNIIRALRGDPDPGAQIPNTTTYQNTWGDARFAGNTYPSGFRLEGVQNVTIIRADVAHIGDDGLFTGDGCAGIGVIGTAFSYVLNNEGGYQGAGPEAWFHNDCWQWTGAIANSFLFDSTLEGHALEWVAQGGNVVNIKADRCWQGVAGAAGGDIGGSGFTVPATVLVGSGAPATRVTGHFYKVFSNGTDHNDGDPQNGYATAGAGANWHTGLNNIGSNLAVVSVSVAVPAGVTVNAAGFITSGIASFLASTDAPHKVFAAAYSASDLMAVLADYSVALA